SDRMQCARRARRGNSTIPIWAIHSNDPLASTRRPSMNRNHDTLLRTVLAFDAITCVLMGAALLAAGSVLGELLAIPPIVLRSAGAVLLVFAAGVGYVARQAELSRAAVITVIVRNALWAIESLLAL